ncbi:DNA-binding response regulator [Flavobacterium sp. NKUCC04_CG]|uniref:DNA-binding response regulator n=1 Tax=Flavobacterium sp. NKUCC04_CG TaxID=2842121 RepID=UPI001C5B52D1|nr:DNA-binding response regulator [Flavobacterium sp. NKUCC04_CG]MBW3518192.1 DNA-binding response regulator [Flavobacterium sp. NKUCC04_CG]
MFKKILVVEDIDSINLGVVAMLQEETDAEVFHCKYCDEAWLKIKSAVLNNAPFDLLISDLSFAADHRETQISNGEDLVKTVKEKYPEIKLMVYSIENRFVTVKKLIDDYKINAFISKGRNSINELKAALVTLATSENVFLSTNIQEVYNNPELVELQEEDITILKYLSEGLSQTEISTNLKKQGSSTSSLSSVEKKVNKLKMYFDAKNTVHLISISKDLGLI